jgi:Zn-dependent protease with chaperone function
LDLTSIYIRVWYRAKSFESRELDALAERIGIVAMLSPNPSKRYFLSKWRTAGNTILNRIVFGERYWAMLTAGERLAVCAHEFIHVRERDSRWKLTHTGLPSVAAALAVAIALYYALGRLALVSVFLAVLAWILALSVTSSLNLGNNRRMELRCDTEAAKFVDPASLVASLQVADSLVSLEVKEGRAYRRLSRSYPTIEERIRAIRAVGEGEKGS